MFKLEEAKANFFDRKKVTDATDAATRSNLSKFGAFTRQRARRSIRKRKAVSAPGEPPSAHSSGTFSLRGSIFFTYEPAAKSVVIGPIRFGTASDPPAPSLLERGGTIARKNKGGKTVTAKYRPRPFMGPAFEETKKALPSIWANSVR